MYSPPFADRQLYQTEVAINNRHLVRHKPATGEEHLTTLCIGSIIDFGSAGLASVSFES